MSSGRWTGVGLILVVAALLGLVACGESEEETALNEVCDARADIERRVDDLASLTVTTVSIEQVTNNLEGIRNDLEKIASEQENLAPERQTEVEQAGQDFRSELQSTAQDVVSGSASGEEAGARAKAALDELAQSFREAYGPLDCD